MIAKNKAPTLMAIVLILLTGISAVLVHSHRTSSSNLTASVNKPQLVNAKQPSVEEAKAKAVESYGKLPLLFENNVGQTDSQVKFFHHRNGKSLFLTEEGAIFSLSNKKGDTERVRMKLLNSNTNPKITPVDEQITKTNYFIGNDASKWRTNIANFGKVKYESVYPGVDTFFYGNESQLEYDLVVAPKADPNQIKLAYEGAKSLSLNKTGDLVVKTQLAEVVQHKPVIYQMIDGQKRFVEGSFSLNKSNTVGFNIGNYDSSYALVIDPQVTVTYSTFVSATGGNGDDFATAIAVDSSGNAYITGYTGSDNGTFPLAGTPYQSVINGGGGNTNAFVSKINVGGTALIYSTYIGGSNVDKAFGIAIDSTGNAYITGNASSTDYPFTTGAFQTTNNGINNAFVTKLNTTGSGLVYSTFLGGSSQDQGNGIAVDSSNNAYIVGTATSTTGFTGFPTTGTSGNGAANAKGIAFVAKFNSTGTALSYGTFLGGTTDETGNGIAVDSSGFAYVTGGTDSTDFPVTRTTGQGSANSGATDAFIAKLTQAGTGLVYATYLGGAGVDVGNGIAVNSAGFAFVTGSTSSPNFPTSTGAIQTARRGTSDAFVTALTIDGSASVYSTYLGGTSSESGTAITADSNGYAFVTGFTTSTGSVNAPSSTPPVNGTAFPTTPAYAFQTTLTGSQDAFVAKLNDFGTKILFSTYLGGSAADTGLGIAVDKTNAFNIYVTGQTNSSNFPTTSGSFRNGVASYGGGSDVFVSKLFSQPGPSTTTLTNNGPVTTGNPITVTATVSGTGAAPTGTVTFTYGGTTTMVTLTPTTATTSTATITVTLPTGSTTFTGTYGGDGNFTTSSGSTSASVTPPATTTTVTGTPSTSVFGQSVSFTATVTSTSTVSEGTVTFTSGGVTLGSGTVSGGTVTITTTVLPTGTDTITASYGGTTNFGSSSGTTSQTVNPLPTTTTVTSNNNPSIFGQSVTFTATVTSSGGTVTGTVNFFDNGTMIGTGTLSGTPGTATYTTSTLSVGSHPITATYVASGNFATSTGSLPTQTVNIAPTTTTVSGTPNPSVFGQSVTFTVSVTSSFTTVNGGTVTLTGGGLNLTATVSNGTATFTTTALTTGANQTITASYGGTTNFGASTGTTTQTVNPANTSTTLTSSPNPSIFGNTVTFTATVAASAPGSGTPTGTVTFHVGGNMFPVTLTGGTATYTTSVLAVGTTMVTASYGATTNYNASTSNTVSQVVNPIPTTTTVTSNNNPSVFGTSVTFTVTVTSTSGTPTGSVALTIDGTPVTGSPLTLTGGTATFSTSALAIGMHSVVATYPTTGNFAGSTGSLTQTVMKAPTTTTVTSTPNPSFFGQLVTITATVTGSGATGTVTFFDNGTQIGAPVTLSGGQATTAVSNLTVGSHTITATYNGDATFNTSTGTTTQMVIKQNTTTTVSDSPNPSNFGQNVTITATVTGSGATGTVTFMDTFGGNTTTIGSATLSGGTATISTSALSGGSHTITATYGGDAFFNGSSGTTTQVVNAVATTTTVTSSPSPSVFGQTVTYTVTVTSGAGTVTGSVTITDGTNTLTVTLVNGTATTTVTNLPVGTATVTATYTATPHFATSTATTSQVVMPANTTTTVTSTPNPSVFGQTVTYTATVAPVAPGAGTPTGTVTFTDGTSTLTGTLSGGVATATTSALPVGIATVTATYGGSTSFNGSAGTTTQTVNKANTTTTVTSAPNPSVFGQAVTYTATVAPVAPGAGTPTGTVTFTDGTNTLTGTLSGGVATATTSNLPVGNITVTATYGGSASFNGSTGTTTQIVNKANTTTTVVDTPNPSIFGQSVTLTATVVAVAPGAGIPTGTVNFFDNGSPIGSGTLSGGVASFSTATLAGGSHTITATYGGSASFNGSTGTTTQTVNAATTNTMVVLSVNPSVFGQPVSYTATVMNAQTAVPVNAGSVTFTDGINTTTLTVNGSGVATTATFTNPVGTRTVTAAYGGTTHFAASMGTATQVVNKANTSTIVTSSVNPSVFNSSVTFTATVTALAPGAGTPTGTVTFTDTFNGVTTTLGTGTLSGTNPDTATFSISTLAPGIHGIVATYGGDGSFNGSAGTFLQSVGGLDHGGLLVADTANNRIQRSTDEGATWKQIGASGGSNAALGRFNGPKGIATNFSQSTIFVADTLNNRIQRSLDSGTTWSVITTVGSTLPSQVNQPQGVAYDEQNDKLYIADTANNRILVATSASGTPSFSIFAGAVAGVKVGQVNQPKGIAIDNAGNVYVADTANNRVQINTNGQSTGWAIFSGATAGTALGKVSVPVGIYVNNSGIVFVADTGNNRIQTNTGSVNGVGGTWSVYMPAGTGAGAVAGPQGVTFTAAGNVFVGDTNNNRVQRKNFSTGVATVVGPPGTPIGKFNQPSGIR